MTETDTLATETPTPLAEDELRLIDASSSTSYGYTGAPMDLTGRQP